jgi:hypothetical protein
VKRRTRRKKEGKRQERGGSAAEGGAERLKGAVDRKVKRNSGELANLLMDKARSGDMQSLRLLVSLSERHKPKEKVVEKESVLAAFGNQVRAWAAEPPWVDPPEEELPPWVDPEEEGETGSESAS